MLKRLLRSLGLAGAPAADAPAKADAPAAGGNRTPGKGGAGRKGAGRGRKRAGDQGAGASDKGKTAAKRKAARKRRRDRAAGEADAALFAKKAERRRRRRAERDATQAGPRPVHCPPDPQGRPVVHLMHIRKTAGTALKEALAPIRETGTPTHAIRPCPHRFTLAHLPPGEKLAVVVRDPIDRYVSGFFSRLREGRPRYENPWTKAERACFERFRTPNALALGLRADDPETREAATKAMQRVNHVRTSLWDWFGDEDRVRARAGDILLIMRQERLAEDFARLKPLIGAPDDLSLPEDDTLAHRNSYGDDAALSEEAVAILRDWYARDYAFLRFAEAELGLAPLEGPTGWQKRLAAARA